MTVISISTALVSVILMCDAFWKHIQNWVRPKPELVIKETYRRRELGELEEDSEARLHSRGRRWRQFRDGLCALLRLKKPEHAKQVDWEMRFQYWEFKMACWKMIAAPVEASANIRTVTSICKRAQRDIAHTQWFMERNHVALPFAIFGFFIFGAWMDSTDDIAKGLPFVGVFVTLYSEWIHLGAISIIVATSIIGYTTRRLLRRRTKLEMRLLDRLANRIISAERAKEERLTEKQET